MTVVPLHGGYRQDGVWQTPPDRRELQMDVDDHAVLLTVDEARQRLHVSRPTMYELINAGRVRSIKIGRARRIPARALEEFVTVELGDDGPSVA